MGSADKMAATAPTTAPAPQVCRGVVKQVLSGDAVIVRGQPKGGPPPERQINFTNVVAPRVARRATANAEETVDEPYAWESREFLRKKVIGKDVLFTVETKTPTGREYGCLYLGSDIETGENVVETMVKEGLLSVRPGVGADSKLTDLENSAKSGNKGKWAGHDNEHKREVKWTCENMRAYVDKAGGKPIPAVIEHIRDGSTVRAFLLPDMQYITLMISGIRCPMNKLDQDGKIDPNNVEPFSAESKYYTESRMLQRDVEIILETFNNNNFVGTIVHPNGNIAESLLREGFARCVDWAMATVTGGPEKLRAAEKVAKDKNVRLWKDFKPKSLGIADRDKDFMGKVVEVVNGDALVVKRQDGTVKKIFLASIRPPRLEAEAERRDKKQFRPLYDIPWLFEAREFLRKKLIGQKVHVKVDYIQPAQNNYPENAYNLTKSLCLQKEVEIEVDAMDKGGNFIGWLHVDGKNLSVHLVEEGLSKVHVTAESSNFYHQLSTKESEAKKKKLNIWSTYSEADEKAAAVDEIDDTTVVRSVDYKPMMISEVKSDGTLFGQYCSDGPALETMMENLRKEFVSNPPLGGAYTPKRGDICAAKFVDGSWYRAKITKISGQNNISVFYIDYGNSELTTSLKLASLPGAFSTSSTKAYAREINLAFAKFPKDEEYLEDAVAALMTEVMDNEVLVNREYRNGTAEYVSMQRSDTKADIVKTLMSQGLVLLDARRDARFTKLMSEYRAAQEEARRIHLNVWRYGDVTDDDAAEFGMER